MNTLTQFVAAIAAVTALLTLLGALRFGGDRPARTAVVLAVSVASAVAILVTHLHDPRVSGGQFTAALLEAWLLLGFVPTVVFYALGRLGGRHPVLLVATWLSTTAVFSVFAVVGALLVFAQAACVPGSECFG